MEQEGKKDATPLHSEYADLPADERHGRFIKDVRRLVTELLNYEDENRLDVDTNLFSLGLNSVMTVMLAARLADAFPYSPSITYIFEHPTINYIAAYLGANLIGRQTSDSEDSVDSSDEDVWHAGEQARFEALLKKFDARQAALAIRLNALLDSFGVTPMSIAG